MSVFRNILVLFTVCLVAHTVQAQIVQDTLDWHRYYPLEVGNHWQYTTYAWPTPIPSYQRREIISDTLVGETRYFQYVFEEVGPFVDPPRHLTGYMRYDTAGTVIGFESIAADTLSFVFDPLDDLRVNFGDTLQTENAPWGDYFVVYGGYEEEVRIGSERYRVAAVKSLFELYATDIGPVSWTVWDGPRTELSYARIAGREFGTGLEAFSTAVEAAEDRVSDISLSIYPNPTQNRALVRMETTVLEEVTIRLYDVLGRQVREVFSGKRQTGVVIRVLDLSSLSSGVYYMVVTTGQGRQLVSPLTKLK